MGGVSQPFMYAAARQDPRFHTTPFDPKAVTRASRNPKPAKPKSTGPLVSFDQHPDSHVVFHTRAGPHSTLGHLTRSLIKWLRRLQLVLRVLQLLAAIGVLFFFSVFKHVDTFTTWAARIVSIVTITHCVYAVFHLSRSPTARTPASTAAYQFFSIPLDFFSMVAYVLGVILVRAKSDEWGTRFSDQTLMSDFVPGVYYSMITASGLHFSIISSSFWLGWTFRKISLMPPDMNPLEDELLDRASHKRNKSSFGAMSEDDDTWTRSGTSYDSRRDSTQAPRTIAFMDTRAKPRISVDDKLPPLNLPDRQYQIQPGSRSGDPSSPTKSQYHSPSMASSPQGSYMKVPFAKAHSGPSEPLLYNRGTGAGAGARHQTRGSKSYSALTQQANAEDSFTDSDLEEGDGGDSFGPGLDREDSARPKPLRLRPASPNRMAGRAKQALRPWMPATASEYRTLPHTSDGKDFVDRNLGTEELEPRQRVSSIQPEEGFSVSNSQTRDSISPIVSDNVRRVSGNDYAAQYSATLHDRHGAGGRLAADKPAGDRFA